MLKEINRVLRLLRHRYGENILLKQFYDGSGGFCTMDSQYIVYWDELAGAEAVIGHLTKELEEEIKLQKISNKS